MQGDQNSSADDIESDESANLADLRRRIQLSNIQLLELTYNDEKFISTIQNLNNHGIQAVHNEQYKEGLIYFNENQKILQYAASCGKTIDRSVIIVTLHNQACVHQKLWDLQKSANYLQAIIYNLNFYLENSQTKLLQLNQTDKKTIKEVQQLTMYARKKQNYALYHLQFCAVNSQIKKHNLSVNSAKSAIKIMKEVCRTSFLLEDSLSATDDVIKIPSQILQYKHILKDLANLDENIQLKNYDTYLKIVKKTIRERQKNHVAQNLLKTFKTFSIGKLMQISPINLEEMQGKPSLEEFFNYQSKITKALYLGISYFTVGTQLRFLSSQKTEDDETDYKLSEEFLLSEVYHIYAILIVMTFVPVETIFLNHLLSSFNNHYLIDLEKISEKQRKTIDLSPIQTKPENNFKKDDELGVNLLPQQSQIKTPIDKKFMTKQSKKSQLKKTQSNKSLRKSQYDKAIFLKRSHNRDREEKAGKKSLSKHKSISKFHDNKAPNSPFEGKKGNQTKKKSKKKVQCLQRKSHSISKSKKNCIYTTRDEKDKNLSSSPEILRSSKQKSKNRSKKTSKSREHHSNLNNQYTKLKKMINSTYQKIEKEVIKKNEKSKGKTKGKKGESLQKKGKKQSRSRPKKPKIKMKKVQISRLAESENQCI